MSTPARLWLRFGVGLIAATAAACGSGNTTSPTPGPTQNGPHAAFIAAADRECTTAHRTLDPRPQPKTLAEVVAYLDTTAQVTSDLEGRLRALKPPADDAPTVSVLLDDIHRLIERTSAARQLAAAGNLAALNGALDDLKLQVTEVGAKARRFGFTSCGIPAPSPPPSATS